MIKQFSFIVSCPECGARNRVRLDPGRRVRIRCGRCGEAIAVDRSRMVLSALWQSVSKFFVYTLPGYLLWLVSGLMKLAGALLRPFEKLWGMLPWKLRKRTAWAALVVLAFFYFLTEGTIQFSSLLLLALLLLIATLVVVVAAKGPSALRELQQKFGGSLLRSCPNCGHRYFGWVKNCPNCGH